MSHAYQPHDAARQSPEHDLVEVSRALSLIVQPGQVTELRALEAVTTADRRPHTFGGYFDGMDALVAAVATIESAKGVYFVPNPIKPALLARAMNRARAVWKDPTTSDDDILSRHWLLIDCDAVRPSAIAASHDEHEAARARATDVDAWLADQGWPAPIIGDSGNGGHLMYRIDLPADDGRLVERCLNALSKKFTDGQVKIDTGVFNPARIWKLYGTWTGKGDPKAAAIGRPQRVSRIIHAPEGLVAVTQDKLEALAALVPVGTSSITASNGKSHVTGFDLPSWIAEHRLDVTGPKPWKGNDCRWVFRQCPWNSGHVNGSAFIVQRPDGKIGAGCHHDSCQGKDWHALRDLIEPGWRDRRLSQAALQQAPTGERIVERMAPWRPFPVELLPDPIGAYAKEAAAAIGCDSSFVALPLLAALAAAIGNTRRIRLKRGWDEPCVLWSAIVGDSGTQKTPALTKATYSIERRQQEALARYEEDLEQYLKEKPAYEAALSDWRKRKPSDRGDMPEEPREPIARRWIVSDITVEALADRLQYAPRGLLLVRDELAGWVKSFDQYKGGKGGDCAQWLTLYNAKSLLVDRKTAGRKVIHVPIASVSIAGGIQVETLQRALGQEHWENGLAARLLLTLPPKRPHRWSEASVPECLNAEVDEIFDRLFELEFDTNQAGEPSPVALPLTTEARRLWREFYDRHGGEMTEMTGSEAALWSKLEGTVPRLALIIHLVRVAAGDETIKTPEAVDAASLTAAVTLADWFGYEARRVYVVLRETDEQRERRRLVEIVQGKGGRITVRQLSRISRKYQPAEVAELTLECLVKDGLGRWEAIPSTETGGKPTRCFMLTVDVDVANAPQEQGEFEGYGNVNKDDEGSIPALADDEGEL